jgi:alcohol dehydrogenase class IV
METSYDTLLKFELPEIIYGLGSLSQIGQCARRLGGERILLVTDPGVTEHGWVDESIKYLEKESLKYVIYDNVVTNPRCFQVEQGAKLYNQKKCDVIVSVGGGSPMDAAKGIAILVSNHGRIHDYAGCNLITQPIPPLICVPTTAGTGSDVSQFSIIGDPRKKIKMTILSRAIMADISLIDPRMLQTKPRELMAATGIDALTHAIEAYVSSLAWPLTDPHAIHAIELVFANLQKAVDTRNIEALEGMAIASLEAGIAFSNAILGAVHALAHPLSGFYDIHHGIANAILLPMVIRKNLPHAVRKFALIASAMGLDTRGMSDVEAAEYVPQMAQELISNLDLPTTLGEIGVKAVDIPAMSRDAAQDLCMQTNPHCYGIEEIESMYREAL